MSKSSRYQFYYFHNCIDNSDYNNHTTNQPVSYTHLLVAECFCAAVIEKYLRNNSLPVSLRRDDTVGGLFCHRQLLSPGTKEGLPVAGKSLLVVGYSVLLCGLCGGGLRLSPCPVFPRLDTVILPLLFKVSRPVLP